MPYGIIEYDQDGHPKCELCGKHFKRVLSHVRQKHEMNEKDYKRQFGFDLKKGICSKESSELSRERTLSNYDKCIARNLMIKGAQTRFKAGDKGRTKDKVSEQTRLRLKGRLKAPFMVDAMRENGKLLGNSGLGNKKRWQHENTQRSNGSD